MFRIRKNLKTNRYKSITAELHSKNSTLTAKRVAARMKDRAIPRSGVVRLNSPDSAKAHLGGINSMGGKQQSNDGGMLNIANGDGNGGRPSSQVEGMIELFYSRIYSCRNGIE